MRDSMTPWDILDIAATNDKREIKSAYVRCLKKIDPNTDTEGFIELRKAFELAIQYADRSIDSEETLSAPVLENNQLFEQSNSSSWNRVNQEWINDKIFLLLKLLPDSIPQALEKLSHMINSIDQQGFDDRLHFEGQLALNLIESYSDEPSILHAFAEKLDWLDIGSNNPVPRYGYAIDQLSAIAIEYELQRRQVEQAIQLRENVRQEPKYLLLWIVVASVAFLFRNSFSDLVILEVVAIIMVSIVQTFSMAIISKIFKLKILEIGFGFGKLLLRIDKLRIKLFPFTGWVSLKDTRRNDVHEDDVENSYNHAPLLSQLAPPLSGPIGLLLLSVIISPEIALNDFITAFPQIFIGAISPVDNAQIFINNFHEFVREESFIAVIALISAKLAAWNILPLPTLSGGNLIQVIYHYFFPDKKFKNAVVNFMLIVTLTIIGSWAFALFYSWWNIYQLSS